MKKTSKINKVEEEIRRKQTHARMAKEKGMHSSYSRYMMDISVLKNELLKLRTSPDKALR